MKAGEVIRLLRQCGFRENGRDSHNHAVYERGEERFLVSAHPGHRYTSVVLQKLNKLRSELHTQRLARSMQSGPGYLLASYARVGMDVRSLRDFVEIPRGTKGTITEDYGTGITVAWSINNISDCFDKSTELVFLEPLL